MPDRPERLIGVDTNVLIDPVQEKPSHRKQVAEEIAGPSERQGQSDA